MLSRIFAISKTGVLIYIGAENIISPLGSSIEEHLISLTDNISGISAFDRAGFSGERLHLAKISGMGDASKFRALLKAALSGLSAQLDEQIISSPDTLLIISSTKGELSDDLKNPFNGAVDELVTLFELKNRPWVISNACISGVHAINMAHDMLLYEKTFEHIIVVGCDVLSDFVVFGFQSLFAISDQACRPFDSERNGVTLGEGCAVTVLSTSAEVFRTKPFCILGGTSANDANHISGPSRTGEGLFRTVTRTLRRNGISHNEIDYISAHGTGTVFNDEMEAIAFNRLGMEAVPVNSLKGYFGHTLGAAGVIECAVVLQSMREGMLYRSLGYTSQGTTNSLNVITENRKQPVTTALKTASGFGGCNASLLIRNL